MKAFYCIQCTDKNSGKTGDFIHIGDFRAISPIFDNLMEFFTWCNQNGWAYPQYNPNLIIEKID